MKCSTKIENPHKQQLYTMEYTGFEPVASTMRMWRAPNCANTPDHVIREAGLPASRWKQRGSNP